MRASVWLALVAISTAAPLAAQDSSARAPGPVCLRARPKPYCSGFFVTNAGSYVVFGGRTGGHTPLRGVVDYGFMANVGARDAVGASMFASLDRVGFSVGPSVRYRRWLTPSASLEVAVGKPVGGDPSFQRAVFGLVKWSPNHWFAIAARPEILRVPAVCGPTTCTYDSRGRASLGVEAGAVPGLVLTGVTAAGFVAFLAILIGAGFGDD